MIIVGDGHTNVEQKDSLKNPVKLAYDVVLTNYPFSQKTEFSNYYGLTTESAGDVLRFLSKKNDVWFPKLKPVPVMGTEKENHTSWERYYRVSDCSSSSRNNWYLGR